MQRSFQTRVFSFRGILALVCILLVFFVGSAQLLHAHSASEAPNGTCGLCAVAHLSVIPAAVLASPIAVETVESVSLPALGATPPRHRTYSLYVRPPPALLTTRS